MLAKIQLDLGLARFVGVQGALLMFVSDIRVLHVVELGLAIIAIHGLLLIVHPAAVAFGEALRRRIDRIWREEPTSSP